MEVVVVEGITPPLVLAEVEEFATTERRRMKVM
jgi:hypothetical protein